jgi:uncharacterized protein (TIGR00725 family)
MLFLNRSAHILHDDNARVFDTIGRVWRRVPESAEGGSEINLFDAVRWLQRESGKPARAPVSIAGPRDASPAELADAKALGHGVAELGLSVLCGGLEGVMTAAAKGAHAAGGTVIGLLPEADWRTANPYITVSLASGVGMARNVLIAEAGLCLVAIGGGYGTMSEMAYAKQFERPVIALQSAPAMDGVDRLGSVEDALTAIARVALNMDGTETAWR